MWTETAQGLHKQFIFADFHQAWTFMEQVRVVIDKLDHHPRWQNNWNTVDFWLLTHAAGDTVTKQDTELARAIDVAAEACDTYI